MKNIAALIICTLFYSYCGQTSKNIYNANENSEFSQSDSLSQHLLFKGHLIDLYTEKAIYTSPNQTNFLMKFTIKNVTDKTVGVDFTDYNKVIYPNQWGIFPKPYREEVNERLIIPDSVINIKSLMTKYRKKTLTFVKPNETIVYYRDWNGSGEKVKLSEKGKYLIVSIDGQMLATDGHDYEQITMNQADETQRTVVIDSPIEIKEMNEKALIIKQK